MAQSFMQSQSASNSTCSTAGEQQSNQTSPRATPTLIRNATTTSEPNAPFIPRSLLRSRFATDLDDYEIPRELRSRQLERERSTAQHAEPGSSRETPGIPSSSKISQLNASAPIAGQHIPDHGASASKGSTTRASNNTSTSPTSSDAQVKEFIPHSLMNSKFARQELQTCPICMDVVEDPVWLPCIHVFCQECLRPWLREKEDCPSCRSKCSYEDTFGEAMPLFGRGARSFDPFQRGWRPPLF